MTVPPFRRPPRMVVTSCLAVSAVVVSTLVGGAPAATATSDQTSGATARAASRATVVRTEAELRSAVQRANGTEGVDRIRLARSISFDESRRRTGGARFGDLDVLDDLVVAGAGRTIDAQHVDRVFDTRAETELRLTGLRLVNGSPDAGESGGAVRAAGTVRLDHTNIVECEVTGGLGTGGAIATTGFLVLEQVRLRMNTASGAGGAVDSRGSGVYVEESRLAFNEAAAGPGGAIHLVGSSIRIDGSHLRHNTATSGGALWKDASSRASLSHTFVRRNAATSEAPGQGGGGIYSGGARLNVLSSEVSHNTAAGAGGAVLSAGGDLRVNRTGMALNAARVAGGAVEVRGGVASFSESSLKQNDAVRGSGGAIHVTDGARLLVIITDFLANSAAVDGGAIWSSSDSATVDASTFRINRASGADAANGGGGIFNAGGTLTVRRTLFDANRATDADLTSGDGSGGAIHSSEGSLSVVGSDLQGNVSSGAGGGLAVVGGTAQVTRSSMLDNAVVGPAGKGGGLQVSGGGTVELDDTDLESNTSPSAGGGIEVDASSLRLSDVDARSNTTGDTLGDGGGLHVSGAAVVTWTRGLVSENHADHEGGGLWNSATGAITLTDVDVRGNTAPVDPQIHTDGGPVTRNP